MTTCACIGALSVRIRQATSTMSRGGAGPQTPRQSSSDERDPREHAATRVTRASRACSAVEMASFRSASRAQEVSNWRQPTPPRSSQPSSTAPRPANAAHSPVDFSRAGPCTPRDETESPRPQVQPDRWNGMTRRPACVIVMATSDTVNIRCSQIWLAHAPTESITKPSELAAA